MELLKGIQKFMASTTVDHEFQDGTIMTADEFTEWARTPPVWVQLLLATAYLEAFKKEHKNAA